MTTYITKDSGARQEFETGARRDIQKGKGRFDLLPAIPMRRLLDLYTTHPDLWSPLETGDEILAALEALDDIYLYAEGCRERDHLAHAAAEVVAAMGGFTPAMKRLAGVYERGAEKYGENNWQKGMPISRYLDSGCRHITQAIGGEQDEDHLGQGLWNVFSVMHTEVVIERGLLPDTLDDTLDYTGPDLNLQLLSN